MSVADRRLVKLANSLTRLQWRTVSRRDPLRRSTLPLHAPRHRDPAAAIRRGFRSRRPVAITRIQVRSARTLRRIPTSLFELAFLTDTSAGQSGRKNAEISRFADQPVPPSPSASLRFLKRKTNKVSRPGQHLFTPGGNKMTISNPARRFNIQLRI
jgi:hypothetical protein